MRLLNPNHYLFIDPGGVWIGWAKWSSKPNVDITGLGTIKGIENIEKWLWELDPKPEFIGVEEYRIRPWVKHNFSKVPTIKCIGSVEHYASLHVIPLVEIPPWAKNSGYKWAGIERPTDKKLTHQSDAVALGAYYLQKNQIKDFLNTDRRQEGT